MDNPGNHKRTERRKPGGNFLTTDTISISVISGLVQHDSAWGATSAFSREGGGISVVRGSLVGDGVVILLEAGGRLGFPEGLVARRTGMEGRFVWSAHTAEFLASTGSSKSSGALS